MKIDLLKKQKEFLEIPHDYQRDIALYMGGYGSGKTFCGALLGILLCKIYPGIRGLVTAQTYPLLKSTTLDMYIQHLDGMGYVDGVHYKFNKADLTIVFNNKSTILFRSAENPSKLKSLNLGFVEIEEMSDIPESTFNMLLSRLRQNNIWGNTFKYRLFGHTNPEANKGWVYKRFVTDRQDNYRLIQAPTTDNHYLPTDYVSELKKAYDPEYFRINVLGEFGDYTKGLVVKGFTDANIHNINYDKDLDLYITCDFNLSPNCWAIAHKSENKIFFIDEFCMDLSTENLIKVVLDKYPHNGKIIINGDASGDSGHSNSNFTDYALIQNELIKRGYEHASDENKHGKTFKFDLRKANGFKKARFYAWNAKIKNADGDVCIFIDPKCKWLIYNCQNLKIIEGTSDYDLPSAYKIKTDNNLKYLGHIYDAASYLVNTYFPIKLDFSKKSEIKAK